MQLKYVADQKQNDSLIWSLNEWKKMHCIGLVRGYQTAEINVENEFTVIPRLWSLMADIDLRK